MYTHNYITQDYHTDLTNRSSEDLIDAIYHLIDDINLNCPGDLRNHIEIWRMNASSRFWKMGKSNLNLINITRLFRFI